MSEDGWTRVRFEEMAQVVTDRVDPAEATENRYVGLEHLDPEDLGIHRWGHPRDVKGSKYRVKAGQIIFGKRRFYQKKIAVAPFDCICSAHAMVLQERPEAVAPGFLSHFMLSDEFVERALSISEGSLSPTIKWKRLAEQEFSLPPLDRQREVVSILEASRRSASAATLAHTVASQLSQAVIVDATESAQHSMSLTDLAVFERGISYSSSDISDEADVGVPLLNLRAVERHGGWRREGLKSWIADAPDDRYIGKTGDLFIANTDLTRDAAVVGSPIVAPAQSGPFVFTLDLSRITVDPDIVVQDYLAEVLRTPLARQHMKSSAFGSTVLHLNLKFGGRFEVPLPPLDAQERAVQQVADIRRIQDELQTNRRLARDMGAALGARILSL